MIVAEISKWLMLALIIIVVVFIIKAGAKIINIIITALLLAFVWFSFFTEIGAARLNLALKGHPIVAYTTKLEKDEKKSTGETSYYKINDEVISNGKKIDYTSCNTFWFIRIPNIEVE